MAQDPPDPKTPRPKQPSSSPLTSPPGSPRTSPLAGRAPVSPVPFEASFAGGAKDGGRGDLSDEDLRDITELLGQQQDVTRQDIPAQDFQALLDRYAKKID
ncbi:MAG TPA: hypothetical protein PLW65_16805 [Pseudomonadota bacterium]|nr:hypothetical protein [Pseudomonadota bacterium]